MLYKYVYLTNIKLLMKLYIYTYILIYEFLLLEEYTSPRIEYINNCKELSVKALQKEVSPRQHIAEYIKLERVSTMYKQVTLL